MRKTRWERLGALFVLVLVLMLLVGVSTRGSQAASGNNGSVGSHKQLGSEANVANGTDEITGRAEQFASVRTAPAATVDAAALIAARSQAAALPLAGPSGSWSQLTNQPYNSDDPNYRDPNISNSGGGAGIVSGRISALAVDPNNSDVVYAGGADGGVWKSTDRGQHWTPVTDGLDSLSTGALAVAPDGAVWLGTGESNTSADSYAGTGVYRSTTGGSSWQRVGGDTFTSRLVGAIAFDGIGSVYIATSTGLYKGAADGSGAYTLVLDAASAGFTPKPYGLSIVNSIAIQPGTNGQVIAVNMAWRGGAAYDGFYISRDGGQHFAYATLNGAINPKSVGRATLAYAADGSKLYAVVEDTQLYNAPQQQNGDSVLAGVFVSPTGDPAGPWNQIADTKKLANSGSALKNSTGYQPGVQAWYNQFLAVDPTNADHVYVGLEETFETLNGGSNWTTIGPYWNFSYPCYQVNPDSCPMAPHSDQHAVAIGGGTLYEGNDGGVYSRGVTAPSQVGGNWNDLNATLHTLQYYYAGAGKNPNGTGDIVWGGMQDNGASKLTPGASTMVQPFGGDGGDTLVDPANGQRSLQEYVDGDIWKTLNGGYDPNTGTPNAFQEISPSCYAFLYVPNPCDPNFRFIAPFRADVTNGAHWVTGGRYVWDNQGKGWATSCAATSCDWQIAYDTGAGHSITAIAANGAVTYAGWCGPCNPASLSTTGSGFGRGLVTNYGGTWHTIGATLPSRYITNVIVDPANAAHVYVTVGGYSRNWIANAGVGHVFASTDGGATFTDISGNLPDAPATDLLLTKTGKLVVSTDVGTFVAAMASPTAWSRLGTGLPNAVVNDLSFGSDGSYIIAATHGRGLWSIPTP